MGAPRDVERALHAALLRVGTEGLRDPVTARAELERRSGSASPDVRRAIALAAAGARLLDLAARGRCPAPAEAVAILATQGLDPPDAEWVHRLWEPLLDQLRDLDQPVATVSDSGAGSSSTLTFLFTDIEGSTRRWQADGDAMRAALALHDELLHDTVTAHEGRIFKHTGDGVCAAFPSPTQAVAAAVDAQLALDRAPWPAGGPLKVRMGLHTGEAGGRADDYEGLVLARAARVQDAGHGGQVLVSTATELLVRHRLPAPLALVSLGVHHLRDAPEPEELFQLSHPDLPSRFDPPRTAHRVRHNLRPQLTNFLGRGDDLEALGDLLARSRLVTLTGPGGVGKTRLSLEVAAAAADRYPDGVWMCELAPVDPDSDVVEAIATSLGVRERGVMPTIDAVERWLRPRHLLLVLDNCEHLLGPVGTFAARVLRCCPEVTLLLSSREGLGLDGERQWLTRPLSVPTGDVRDPVEAGGYEAVRLFVERVRAVRNDFVLDTGNVAEVVEICRRLDGMPLALELAAARMQALGPSELLDHLDERFSLLGGRRREPRQTLRGAVAWSYGLLDEDQRRLFRRLSVFAGSWSLPACRAVCRDDGLDDLDLVDVLAELVAKSLVVTDLEPGGARYRMLETLRHYGHEQLDASGEAHDVRRRHAVWACGLVEGTAPGLRGEHERESGDAIHRELDNLRAAFAWAMSEGEADLAFGLVAPLEDYAILRLDHEVIAWAEQLLGVPAWAGHPSRHLVLGLVGHATWARGDLDGALRIGSEALAVERERCARPSWAARQAVANSVWFRGWTDQAPAPFLEWIERAREEGDDFQLAWGLSQWAVAAAFLDPTPANRALADEALALARRCGNPFLVALALYAQSEWVIDDDPARALELLEEGVAVGRGSGNRYSYGFCLSTVASLTGRMGDPAEALTLYRLALENWRVAGNWSNQRVLLRNLAEFASRVAQHELTARILGALDASGEMAAADLGPEGRRLDEAITRSRRALGAERYDELHRAGAGVHPVGVVRETLAALDRLDLPEGTVRPHVGTGGRQPAVALSAREKEIVALVAAGLTNRGIAERLFISERTVDTHMTRIRRKVGAATRTQLAVWGLDHLVASPIA